MADKRTYDLQAGTMVSSDSILFDRLGFSEAKKIAISDFVNFISNSLGSVKSTLFAGTLPPDPNNGIDPPGSNTITGSVNGDIYLEYVAGSELTFWQKVAGTWNFVTTVDLENLATDSLIGHTRIATLAEVEAGVENFAYVTPLTLATLLSGDVQDTNDARYVKLNGDNTPMTGALILNADATNVLGAVTLQQATALVTGLWDDRGNFTPSGSYPSTGGSGTAGAILKGDIWTIDGLGLGVSATMGSETVYDGYTVRALSDSPSQTDDNWAVGNKGLGYTPLSNVLNSAKIFVGNPSNVATGVDFILNATGGTFALANTGVLTMPNAATGTRGLLTSTDWNKFNDKVGGTGTADVVAKFTASGTLGNSLITAYSTHVEIGGGGGSNFIFNLHRNGNQQAFLVNAAATARTTANMPLIEMRDTATGTTQTTLLITQSGTGLGLQVVGGVIFSDTASNDNYLQFTRSAVSGYAYLTNQAVKRAGVYNIAEDSTSDWANITNESGSHSFNILTYPESYIGGSLAGLSFARKTFLKSTDSLILEASSSLGQIYFVTDITASTPTQAGRVTQAGNLIWGGGNNATEESGVAVQINGSGTFNLNINSTGSSAIQFLTAATQTGYIQVSSATGNDLTIVGINRNVSLNATGANRVDLITNGVVGVSVSSAGLLTANAGISIAASNLTFAESSNMVFQTSAGTKIGTATGQKIAFWNVTPINQPASANQAALTNNTGGGYNGTLVDTANALDIAASSIKCNDNFTDIHTLLNEIRNVLVNTGLMKGAA